MIAVFFFLLISTYVGHAQVINAESERKHSDSAGWKGNLGMNMTLIQNTQTIFLVNAESHLQYTTTGDKGLWLFLGSYGFLKTNGVENVSNAYLHIRYNKKLNNWLRWEIFGQYQNNAITQIDSRFLFGTGPRFKLIKVKKFRMYTGCLFMYEREKEKTDPVIVHNDLRNSSYISFSWNPRENIELTSTTYYQPLLKKFADYRVMNQLGFKINATPHFGMETKWSYLYDSYPAGEAPKAPFLFSTGFSYDF